jgi:hypothetical protein
MSLNNNKFRFTYMYIYTIAYAFHHEIWYLGFDIQYFIPTCWLHLLKIVKQHDCFF